MKKRLLLPIWACFLFVTLSYADIQQTPYQNEKIVVTATRYEQAETDITPSMTVIQREDILNLQANNILDLLVLQQGIDVARTGGSGSQTSVFLRGTNSNHTLVLINGMRVGSSFTGSFAWENLPISQIERIEIVRGSRVSYYGSDAIGGVINIITRKQNNLYARYTVGSFNTHNLDAGYGYSTEKGHYSLVIGSNHVEGFSASNENNIFAFNPDKDGHENNNLNLSVSYNLAASELSFNYLESRSNVDFDSFFDASVSNASDRVVDLSWNGQILNSWNTELTIGNNRNTLVTKVSSSDYISNRLTVDGLMNKKINNKHIGFGFTYRHEDSEFNHAIANPLNYESARHNIATFINWLGTYNKATLNLSGRYDHNNVYGDNVTGNIDWSHQTNANLKLNLSAGTAFHAPNLNELFSPQLLSGGFFSFEGNPDLKPEESLNYEIGLKRNITEQQNMSINVFYYKIDNLIDFLGPTFKPTNINQATIKGVEAAYNFQRNNFNLSVNATVQNANNDVTDSPLLRRPDNKVNISVDKFFNKFSVGSSVRYASKNPDFGIDLDSYTVIDLRAAYKINDNWRISAKIENAADEKYQVVNGYNTPQASGYISIEWQQ